MTRLAILAYLLLCLAPAANAQEPKEPKEPKESAEPAAEEDAPAEDTADVDALRKEYEKIREALFTSRARAAAVGDALYSTRLEVRLAYKSGRFYTIKRATIRLDGANVFDDTAGVIAGGEGSDAPRFTGFVAPGRHLMTIRIEAQSKDDDRIVYTTEDTFSFDAPQDKDVTVNARAEDGGDIGWNWKRKTRGSYKLRLDVAIEAKKRQESAGGKK